MSKLKQQEVVYRLHDKNKSIKIDDNTSYIINNQCIRDEVEYNRFWFTFTPEWRTANIKERVIGFRSLWIPICQRILKFELHLSMCDAEGETCPIEIIPMTIYLNVDEHFEDIIRKMQSKMKEYIDSQESLFKVAMLDMRYETINHEKCFIIESSPLEEYKKYKLKFAINEPNDDAKVILNITGTVDFTDKLICKNIWTRHRCLLRSSISINNCSNYLGYSQKDYNPIKYYTINTAETRFYIDLYDAHDTDVKVNLPIDNKEGLVLEMIIPEDD